MKTRDIIIYVLVAILVIAGIGYGVWYWWYHKKEMFWDIPSRTWKVERMFARGGDEYGTSTGGCGPDFFQTPNFQGILSPRFSNVDYGADLRTQLPGYDTFGVPADPLGGDVGGSFSAKYSGCRTQTPALKESYDNNDASPYNVMRSDNSAYQRFGGCDPMNASGYANGNYKEVLADGVMDVNNMCNQGDVNEATFLTQNGEMQQPIIYDRYIYANRKSRLRAQGDPWRGDLPIVPASGNWFVPSVHPNIDLQPGALNVMAGVNNETSHQLANLIYNTSGGADTTIGGVDMSSMNVNNQIFGATSAAGGDVIMTSFP